MRLMRLHVIKLKKKMMTRMTTAQSKIGPFLDRLVSAPNNLFSLFLVVSDGGKYDPL